MNHLIIFICLTNSFFYALSEKLINPRSIIDLSYTFIEKGTPTHPTSTKFELRLSKKGKTKEGVWFLSNNIFTGEHVGTHVDVPLHMNENMYAVDEIPIEKLYRVPGITIDVSEQVRGNHNYRVQVKDINNWIEEHGPIPDGAIIIIRTGWGKKALDERAYLGTDGNGNLNFPGISKKAVEWMVMYKNSSASLSKGIVAVAIDTLSFDSGNNRQYEAHLALLNAGLFGIENLANSEKLPAKDFTITMFPIKIDKGTGGPIRVIAEINGTPFTVQDMSTGQKLTSYTNMSYLMMLLTLSASLLM